MDDVFVDPIVGAILCSVLIGGIDMRQARERMRKWHASLSPEQAAKLHANKMAISRRISAAAEGLAQEMLTLASGAPAEP